jgi:hypothetical protein
VPCFSQSMHAARRPLPALHATCCGAP